jgi:iron complex transport system substrate-binding protein
MRRTLILSLVAGLASAVLTAGGAGATAPGGAALASQHPVTVAQHSDHTVQGQHLPTRILSLSPSATEMLYAIGAGHQVVGVDKYSTWPADAPRTSFTGYESSAEDYLPLHPDLVVLAFDTTNLVAQLRALHIPTLLLQPATTIAAAESQITELGQATGHRVGASRAIATLNRDLARSVASAKGRGKGATYYVEIGPTYYSATSHTFIGALFARFGMRNIADKAAKLSAGYPQLSAEYVLTANPDYVFLADTVCCRQSEKTFAARPGFSTLRAVRLHHVVAVNDSIASEWGPHSLEIFIAAIADALDGRPIPAAAR